MNLSTAPTYTLVLGSGGARGLAHIGVLSVLESAGIRIGAVVGSSMGAQIGAFWAAGYTAQELEVEACRYGILGSAYLFLPNRLKSGFSSGPGANRIIQRFVGGRRLEDFPTPVCLVGCDVQTGERVDMRHGDAALAVRASIAIPGLLTPVRVGDRTLTDGAMASPLPLDAARQHFPGPIIAVDVQTYRHERIPQSPLGLFRRANCLMQNRLAQEETRRQKPEIIIIPDTNALGTFQFHTPTIAIEAGKRAAESALESWAAMSRQPQIASVSACA